MVRITTHLTISLLAACAVLAPLQVSAEEICPPAEWVQIVSLSKEAKTLVAAGKYDDALARLKSAWAICPEPKLHRSMGMVLEKAARNDEALAEFRLCVNEKKVPLATRMECKQRIEVLEKASGAAVAVAVREDVRVKAQAEVVKDPVPVVKQADPVVTGGVPEVAKAIQSEPVLEPVPASVKESDKTATVDIVKSALSKPKAVGNWVGVGIGIAATGLGTAFLIRYGMDRAAAHDVPYQDVDGWHAADVVGPRNLAMGISFSVAGVTAVILSAALWPKSKVKASAAPMPGGGFLALTVDM